jgi:hypothetical protein
VGSFAKAAGEIAQNAGRQISGSISGIFHIPHGYSCYRWRMGVAVGDSAASRPLIRIDLARFEYGFPAK